eukprot:m.22012 g.22012  ORF g.22012 m.22012 type:complete len:95 (-) comp8345_c0_seq1:573-857(-)
MKARTQHFSQLFPIDQPPKHVATQSLQSTRIVSWIKGKEKRARLQNETMGTILTPSVSFFISTFFKAHVSLVRLLTHFHTAPNCPFPTGEESFS